MGRPCLRRGPYPPIPFAPNLSTRSILDRPRPRVSTQYIEARRFLSDLEGAQKALARPDAGDYFTRKYAAQGRTIAELVKHMTSRGLTFAPAVPGDGAAYLALHRAMTDYHVTTKARLAAER